MLCTRLWPVLVLCLACDSSDAGTATAKKGDANSEAKADAKTEAKVDATTDAKVETKAETKAEAKAPGATPAAKPGTSLRLVGHVDLPGAQKLEFKAKLDKTPDGYTGAMDIPMQGAVGVPLTNISASQGELSFGLANGATWKASIAKDGTVSCAFSQAGADMTCSMQLVDDAAYAEAGPKRPQTPTPPFPYDTKDIEWDATEGVHLAGTVVTPRGPGPHPAVVFISGSGQQDRDETLLGHKPFAVIADKLARSGVASLRYDDRGVGKSTGDVNGLTMELEAGDAESALQQLAKTEGIDPKRIGFIGHSAGGVIAPLVATKRPTEVAFMVLIAGSGVTGKALHAKQAEALLKSAGLPQAQIDEANKHNEAIYEVLESKRSDVDRATALREVLKTAGVTGPAVDAQVEMVNSAWFRHFLAHDPAPVLEKVSCPVLVLNGELDLQVLPDQNVPAIEAALVKGGNGDITIKRFAGLNHLLQAAKTGMPSEYNTIETTMDQTALNVIDTWVRLKTGV